MYSKKHKMVDISIVEHVDKSGHFNEIICQSVQKTMKNTESETLFMWCNWAEKSTTLLKRFKAKLQWHMWISYDRHS